MIANAIVMKEILVSSTGDEKNCSGTYCQLKSYQQRLGIYFVRRECKRFTKLTAAV